MNKLNKLLTTTLVATALLVTSVQAASYTKSYGNSWSTSTSTGQSNTVTYRQGRSVMNTQDTASGGLSGCSNCSQDNVITTKERVVVNTNLVIADIGNSQGSSSTTSCFSGINVNGLNATEGKSTTTGTLTGNNLVTATGSVDTFARTKVTTSNGGAEIGTKIDVMNDNTIVNEITNTTFSSGSNVTTYTSSTGR